MLQDLYGPDPAAFNDHSDLYISAVALARAEVLSVPIGLFRHLFRIDNGFLLCFFFGSSGCLFKSPLYGIDDAV